MAERPFNMKLIDKRRKAYQNANKQTKVKILDQLINDTGYNRKSLVRALNKKAPSKSNTGGRPLKYDQQIRNMLSLVWEYADYIAAERFHPQLPEILDDLETAGLLSNYSRRDKNLLRQMPLGSVKYHLRKLIKPRRKLGTRTSQPLRKQVPIRTGFHTNITSGYFAIDFVDHCGESSEGKFSRTLCMVDPKTTWIARRACLGKDRVAVEDVWDQIYPVIPYRMRGLHSDNEPNLLHTLLGEKSRHQKFEISRSRPYRKEDNGHVEQKNGDKVRNLVGYKRYDSEKAVTTLNELYRIDDLFQNHFVPSLRLQSKEYDLLGKVTRKHYEPPMTAYQRVMSDPNIPLSAKLKLTTIHTKLNRIDLKTQRDKLLRILFNLK